ncbi:imidazoleglycerol-phosphate dehydratase HisB [Hydrogeniiclostridium mannosilyticum]|uniref:imidazoleglycerol-phosphate dehydratase HisB n=1 Tax=Hydrogeniiclostridium mannosilyticum TaxID=2764322 RepID=UPI0018A9FAB7|nr:imidazoleglycerol-phosphate dehydratase HisB [Hydrogeniiclostridium mannosilyticum]
MKAVRLSRKTRETDIALELDPAGGAVEISTGIGFFDHMLTAFAVHGGFGLRVRVQGDLEVDGHHTVEDTGIVLGRAFAEALADKSGIARFGSFYIPMDEALAFAAVDVSGRPFLEFRAAFSQAVCGQYDVCLTEEFFRAFVANAAVTLHVRVEYGKNAHHEVEAVFKACAHALRLALAPKEGLLSTKGVL